MAMRNYTKWIFFLKEATGHIIGRAQGFQGIVKLSFLENFIGGIMI